MSHPLTDSFAPWSLVVAGIIKWKSSVKHGIEHLFGHSSSTSTNCLTSGVSRYSSSSSLSHRQRRDFLASCRLLAMETRSHPAEAKSWHPTQS